MRTVLFVDDERLILEGLTMALRRYRKTWKMEFACGYDEAIASLGTSVPDAVVSDVRMPGPGGIGLLRHFREHHPEVARLVLTGQTSAEAARELTSLAHRHLVKPSTPETIHEAVERICDLQEIMANEALRSLVGRIGHLAPLPRAYQCLMELMQEPDCGAARIAAVIESDPGLAANVLHVVNSGFFGRAYSLRSLEHAVSFLGMDLLQSLVLSMEVLGQYSGPGNDFVDQNAIARHGLLTARIAGRLAETHTEPAAPGESKALLAGTAGLLHNLGLLVLTNRAPELLDELARDMRETGASLIDAETRHVGTTHDHLGAYLLGLWGFPTAVVECVAQRQKTDQPGGFDLLDVLRVSAGLASEQVPLAFQHADAVRANAEAAATRLGLNGLDGWREHAMSMVVEIDVAA